MSTRGKNWLVKKGRHRGYWGSSKEGRGVGSKLLGSSGESGDLN